MNEGLLTLPKLYPIVDKATLSARGIDAEELARALRDAGVTLLQYRDKTSAPQEILQAAARIVAVFSGVDATLILNDRADLALLAGWGVHVGHLDLSPRDARLAIGAKRVIGVSTHNDAQIIAADASDANYIAVGPVFATSTKANAEAVIGLEGVQRARALTKKPLVAIGGITRQNARSVIDAGADSVAVISGLLVDGEHPRKAAEDFLEILR